MTAKEILHTTVFVLTLVTNFPVISPGTFAGVWSDTLPVHSAALPALGHAMTRALLVTGTTIIHRSEFIDRLFLWHCSCTIFCYCAY